MPSYKHFSVLEAEEIYKEKVYKQFDAMRNRARNIESGLGNDILNERFEDQAGFMVYGKYANARERRHKIETIIQNLYHRPYFAHIEALEDDEPDTSHYYLSDCEYLDEMVPINNDGFLLPFKKDSQRPITSALFHCFQAKKGDPVYYIGHGEYCVLEPKLICEDEIKNRNLIDAVQLYPEAPFLQISADELLEEKLQENRNNPALRNIIATLQRLQFEIIETDSKQSFIVQGCAGSGKSQCLFHRLFFLRDDLSQSGWNHVLVLTPTQLFRNYSESLMKRYQISNVENCSIADLYHTLLSAYDKRFKNRQYRFELSEEYLPDGYLSTIYEKNNITRIESEIHNAILKYVSDGCSALGIEIPDKITKQYINNLVIRLDEELQSFDLRETLLQKNKLYSEKRRQYDEYQKELDSIEQNIEKYTDEYDKIIQNRLNLESMISAYRDADKERSEWHKQRDIDIENAINELKKIKSVWNTDNEIQIPAKYAQQLAAVEDMLYGERHKADEEYEQFLDEYCAQMESDLYKVIKKSKPETVIARYERRKNDILEKKEKLFILTEDITRKIEEYTEWFRNNSEFSNNEISKISVHRSDIERAKYFLSRIETTVFEKEVWNTIRPLKEKYNVQALQIDELEGGKKKETRILYKSDLLFYLKIYAALYTDAKLPDYTLICVDEGQDLNKADYDMLHQIYPNAVFNIFGDTEQVLHNGCGIDDWTLETGIERVYSLNRNYRNTAAIVDFCNDKFGSDMKYVGRVLKRQRPHILDSPKQIKAAVEISDIAVIVKNRTNLEKLCMYMGKPISDFEYMDTKTERQIGGKIPSYSIYAAKGLEFSKAIVYAAGMTKNQKVVACTRAMEDLYYYE